MSKINVVFSQCKKCGDYRARLERHHITYHPPQLALLCRACHAKITHINTRAAIENGLMRLSNQERRKLWRKFLSLKPRGYVSKTQIMKILLGGY